MRPKITTRLKNAFQQLSSPISTCKNCFKDIEIFNLYSLLNKDSTVCKKCLNLYTPKFSRFKFENIKILAIYDYDDFMKDLIYKFKGCYDYELKSVFLEMYKKELSILFKGYTMIPAPSYEQDDKIRGFNHVVEIFKTLKLPMTLAFTKTEKFKQADHNFKERQKIKNYIQLNKNITLSKKVLLVDDIFTTGSTIKTMINALKEQGIKDIKVLVLCRTKLNENEH